MLLAQFNIGKLNGDIGDPRLDNYIAAAEVVNKVAERAEGFVWKYETVMGGGTNIIIDDDPRIVVNLSVWQSLSSLKHFVWKTLHTKIYERRAEWFTPMKKRSLVLWNIPNNERPDIPTAVKRLNHLRKTGASDYAFDWEYANSFK